MTELQQTPPDSGHEKPATPWRFLIVFGLLTAAFLIYAFFFKTR